MANFDFSSTRPIRPSKLAHVVFRTANKKAMTQFYVDFLCGSVTHENEVLSFVTYDEEHHRIAIGEMPILQPRDPRRCGLEHVAFTFDTLSELFLAYRQRKAKGILPVWCINHGMTISLYYRDPDGNMLETQYDTMDSDQATVFMKGERFAANPIGVDFDPEEFIKRIQSGESMESLCRQEDIGVRGLDSVPSMKELMAAA